jgi:hypothetical protein
MPTIPSTLEQPLTTLATHQEMDEFSQRHGLPLVTLDFAEFEVQAIYKLLRRHLQVARRDTSLGKENQERLIAGFEARRRWISAAVARESRQRFRPARIEVRIEDLRFDEGT